MFFFILSYKPEVKPTGTSINCSIVTSDALSSVHPTTIEVPRGMKIGEAVKRIAQDYGFRFSLANYPKGSTIQPTSNTVADGYGFSSGETLIQVFRRLASLARDERGGDGFRVYQDHAGNLHFHTAFYAPAITGHYVYGNNPNGEVISFEMADNTIDAAFIGAGEAIHEAVDGYGGTSVQMRGTASQLAGKRGTQVEGEGGILPKPPPDYSSAVEKAQDRLQAETGALIQSPETNTEVWAAKMRYRKTRLAELTYTANMVVVGTHAINPYDRIIVEVRYRAGQLHPISGLFLVTRVNHMVGGGGSWKTELGLAKMTRSMAYVDTANGIIKVDAENIIRTIEAYAFASSSVQVRKGPS
jgi:hypothetical protein